MFLFVAQNLSHAHTHIHRSIMVGHEVVSSIVAWKKHLSLNIRQPLTNKVCKPKKNICIQLNILPLSLSVIKRHKS